MNQQQQGPRKSYKKTNIREKEIASNHQQQGEDKCSESPTIGNRKKENALIYQQNRARKHYHSRGKEITPNHHQLGARKCFE